MGYVRWVPVEFTREYLSWFGSLRDSRTRTRILTRVERLSAGHPGSHRHLGEGVFELKVDFGPGYRVYYSMLGPNRLTMLAGGDKSTQTRDIGKAMELGRQYRRGKE
jgi:putative addiction module killer protein